MATDREQEWFVGAPATQVLSTQVPHLRTDAEARRDRIWKKPASQPGFAEAVELFRHIAAWGTLISLTGCGFEPGGAVPITAPPISGLTGDFGRIDFETVPGRMAATK